ncbi:MAG: cysteine desulfurase [Oscillospiraceae bacterium]|nr:cysteine desulfurase [Oscillospiraceae bacterium]
MIYLDNAATTKPCEAAVKAMIQAAEEFGNPSSLHGLGLRAEKLIGAAKETLAGMLGGDKKNIYFTSGGTEANNLAVLGTAHRLAKQGRRVITSKIEHPSVLEAVKRLGEEGFDVVFADVLPDGRVDIEKLKEQLTEDTILVSIMHVNNETGVIQPIEEIAAAVHERCPKAIFHSDCVQSFGKVPINLRTLNVDMVTISAHKIHGFKGCGALYMKNPRVTPILYGGEQQNEIRPGTENVGGILAFAAAAEKCGCDMEGLRVKRDLMKSELAKRLDFISFNGSDEHNAGSVLNVSFNGIKAEILLHSLERHEIYVSTGSACSSHKPQPSHVLTAMGAAKPAITGAVRISFSEKTTNEEIIEAAEKIASEAAMIKKYMR